TDDVPAGAFAACSLSRGHVDTSGFHGIFDIGQFVALYLLGTELVTTDKLNAPVEREHEYRRDRDQRDDARNPVQPLTATDEVEIGVPVIQPPPHRDRAIRLFGR